MGPCDRFTSVAGVVKDGLSGQPVSSASVRIDEYETRSKASGCFTIGSVHSGPLQVGVSAASYEPVAIKAPPGTYLATVTLMPVGSSGGSSVTTGISRPQYAQFARDCHN